MCDPPHRCRGGEWAGRQEGVSDYLFRNSQLSRGGGSNLKVGGTWRAYKGVWGQSPQRGPEAERFLGIIRRKDRQYLPLYRLPNF